MSPLPTQLWVEMLRKPKEQSRKGKCSLSHSHPCTDDSVNIAASWGRENTAKGWKQAVDPSEGPERGDGREVPLLAHYRRETHRLEAGSRWKEKQIIQVT